ncbi:ribonuclease P protein component [uncultured Thiodictyon sp.]|uniref:ribonuclease P protein component n=1 Tax=uncultured Thiodictyon sp. TaxID=1846217 RepID=UPI0025E0FFBC|nr:ribonuclease P protein component [uncultured Thiodictyon sp.]
MATILDSTDLTERFPRSRRLVQADQFKQVFEYSARFDGNGFFLLARINKQPKARLGLAISKRSCPRAVDRNRLKRIARASFRLNANTLPAVDIVVLCAPKARHLSNRDLFDGLDRVWRKVIGKTWVES